MRSMFIQLQEELLKSDCDVVIALRRAHGIAKQLNLIEFDSWIQNELNGYNCSVKELPKYRKLRGSITAFNPYNGRWIPYVIEDEKTEEILSTAPMIEPISTIVQLCGTDKSGTHEFRYNGNIQRKLEKMVDFPEGLDISLHVQTAHIYSIIESVKNILLEWVIDNLIKTDENPTAIVEDFRIPKDHFSKVFIVHGHDIALRESLARLLEKQGITPVILFEQPNQGATIIEKFERDSDVSAAICLFTADDIGKVKNSDHECPRARQNVIFESGFFIGKLGRHNVIFLADKDVELPSDLNGVVYTDSSNWQIEVMKELKAMGFKIDLNHI